MTVTLKRPEHERETNAGPESGGLGEPPRCRAGDGVRRRAPRRSASGGRPRSPAAHPPVPAALADRAPLQLLLSVQLVPVDPVRHHQQHLHQVLQGGELHHRLDVHDLHADLHPLHFPGDLAAGQEGAPGRGARGHGAQLRRDVGEGGQRPARPVPGHLPGPVLLLVRAGLHPGVAVQDRLGVVRFGGGVHRLLHRSLRESGDAHRANKGRVGHLHGC